MYIDSPDFSRRKVVNAHNASQPTTHPQQYQFGLERSLLARHVAERLNSHQQDDQILQRFRRQAQELKHQRWLSKKAKLPSPLPQPLAPAKVQSQEIIKQSQEQQYPKLIPVTSVILPNESEQKKKSKSIRDREALKLERLLHSKEKELKRKDRKLERSRQLIEKMEWKIKDLQRQKQLGVQKEELQNQKITALIEEMNYRIAANRAIFHEQLAKLKAEQESRRTIPLTLPKTTEEIPSPSIALNRKRKLAFRADSDRLLRGPSIFYELPKTNEVTTNLNLSLLSKHSKNKLQKSNPEYY